jgi:hypothetical protein
MRISQIHVYNKPLLYIGALIGTVPAWYDAAKSTNTLYFLPLYVIGIVMMLISFRKPKGFREETE